MRTAAATASEVQRANRQLLDTVAALVAEFDDTPAGVVLGAFSRAVRAARRAGCPIARLAVEAERATRDQLRPARVPLPRSG